MLGGGLMQGLIVTARNFVQSYYDPSRLTTVEYPEQKPAVPENSRCFPFLIFDESPDNPRCVACKICEQECPPQCIYIEVDRDPKTNKPIRRPRVFDIDISVCMQCQICVEVCPFDSIKMDKVYEVARTDRFDGLLADKSFLLKSNEYYHKIRPAEADEVDGRLAKTKKKTAPAAAKPVPAAPVPSAVPPAPVSAPVAKITVPADAPFSPEQRVYLEKLINTVAGGSPATPIVAQSTPAATPSPDATPVAPAEALPPAPADEPWHDPSLNMEQRMSMSKGKPLELRLMAAMAQLDCHACGYDCKGYGAAIADGTEKDLSLCVPGEKPTEEMLKEILKAEGKL